jgi:hypothetical protein
VADERLPGVGFDGGQEGALLAPLRNPELDRAVAQPGQPLGQGRLPVRADREQHLARDLVGPLAVELLHERGRQRGRGEGLDLVNGEPAAADDPAPADEEHLHDRLQVVLGEGGDVEVVRGGRDHLLLLHGGAQAAELVAEPRGQLVVEPGGGVAHLLLQPGDDRAGAAVHELDEVLDDLAVGLGADLARAGARALADVVQDAGPVAAPGPVVHALGAGPHREGAQQQVQRLPDRVGVGVGAEVAHALALGAAHHPRARDLLVQRDREPRVALVVAVADVVAGPVPLDQGVLELEGLDLAVDQHPLHGGRRVDHRRGARVQAAHRLEVVGQPLAQ